MIYFFFFPKIVQFSKASLSPITKNRTAFQKSDKVFLLPFLHFAYCRIIVFPTQHPEIAILFTFDGGCPRLEVDQSLLTEGHPVGELGHLDVVLVGEELELGHYCRDFVELGGHRVWAEE
jgi:hypothetical protein